MHYRSARNVGRSLTVCTLTSPSRPLADIYFSSQKKKKKEEEECRRGRNRLEKNILFKTKRDTFHLEKQGGEDHSVTQSTV